MKDYTSKFRVYPTPYLFDKIFTISPEFTWDLNNFVTIIIYSALRNQAAGVEG